ncbi:transposase [uncultured Martelella sp.]|uniref:IS110 family transposase n=1 Tax=uncultured Martelella sp. TaxID=392331 RepID=UPI0029C9ADC6|nr:transposase [uncultured Martelella sp.]
MIHPVFIGCDVSKAHLDIFDPRTCTYLRIDNLASCIETWLDSLDERNVTVIFEATSPYDRRLCLALARRGCAYCRVNPARARDFARACGLLAKTDAIDARMLARMGETL